MALSPSTVDRPPPGECVVCGKATTLRCPICAKAGLDWVFFCSRGHQTLIWKVHKRVCGKKIFEWPLLTDKEEQEFWDSRHQICDSEFSAAVLDLWSGSGPPSETAASNIAADASVRDTFFETVVINGAKRSTLQDPEAPHGHVNKLVRSKAFERKFASSSAAGTELSGDVQSRHRLVVQDPFGFLAFLMEQHEPFRLSRVWTDPREHEVHSLLQHRLSIFVATLVATFESQNTSGSRPEGIGSIAYVAQACKDVGSDIDQQATIDRDCVEALCRHALDFVGIDP
ncbi:hypothetical protein JCM3766R1_000334 [Sporobolomyces carnicolor]